MLRNGKNKFIIGLMLILTTVLLSYFVTFFYTDDPTEGKIRFIGNPGEWEYLSHFLWRLQLSIRIAVFSYIMYFFVPGKYGWIKDMFLTYFIVESVMVFNYAFNGNQISVAYYVILLLGIWAVTIIKRLKFKDFGIYV